MSNVTVGEKIAELMRCRHWSLGQVEHYSGVSANYVGKLIKGERKDPGFSVVAALAAAFDVSLNWFADRPDPDADPAVLTPDEEELIRLYRAITDPKLRQVALNSVRLQAEYDQLQDR